MVSQLIFGLSCLNHLLAFINLAIILSPMNLRSMYLAFSLFAVIVPPHTMIPQISAIALLSIYRCRVLAGGW